MVRGFESHSLHQVQKRIKMLKPTSNYKMSKTTKASLSLGRFSNQQQRNDWKRSMIQAELSASIQPRREKGRKESAE